MAEENTEPKTEPRSKTSENYMHDAYFGTAELTYRKSPWVADTYKEPYNTDDLWEKTGDYSLYEEMLQDDQASVCLQLKKDLVIGSGFDFVSEEDGQEEIIEDLQDAFENGCDIPFVEAVEELLTAYEFGFSITEKIFKLSDDGKLRLKALKTRHPNSWLIHQDDKGNVTKYEQQTTSGPLAVNEKALIHYVNKRKFQNPYGESDLRAAYQAWIAKRHVVRFYSIYLESAAKPIPVASYDNNAPQSAIDKIFNSIKNFQVKTALTLPKQIELEFLEAKSNGEAYSKAINIFNMFIGRALFIPDLVGFTGSETGGGSHALGKEQIQIFFMHVLRRRAALEKIINKHIVWPMVAYNFGDVKNYPKFRFKPLDEWQAGELAKVWLEAVKGKVYKPNEEEINYFRKLVRFPEGEVEFAADPMALGQDGEPLKPGDKPMPGKPGEKPEKTDEKEDKKTFGKVFDQVNGDYHKKVNFKAIENKLNDYDNSLLSECQPILRKMFSDLYDQIEKKKILKNQNADRIDSISLKYKKELQQALKASFREIYKDGQIQAQEEILKHNFRAPTTSEKFLELLENETFQFIGDFEYQITKKVRLELIAAIKDGKPLSEVLDVLDDEGRRLSEVQLERFARTKHTEVLNRGRHAFFEDSEVVVAYQYSAILDGQTSAICRGLHGKIFKAGKEPIPPLHHNCRSLLIPITKYEQFEESTSVGKTPISDFIDENKGEGFAVK